MLSRRCRIQARPNVASGAKKSKSAQPNPVSPCRIRSEVTFLPPASSPQTAVEGSTFGVAPSGGTLVEAEECEPVTVIPEFVAVDSAEASTSAVKNRSSVTSEYTPPPVTPPRSLYLDSPNSSQSSSPFKSPGPQSPLKSPTSVANSVSFCESELTHRSRTVSSASYCLSPSSKSDYPPKVKRRFTGDEPLDPKKMTMQDLISWNPRNEKRLHEDPRGKRRDSVADSEGSQKKDVENETKPKPVFAAPQVKIAKDGSLVIDESSLTITNENDSSVWETVEEDRAFKKLNSMSFRKRPFYRGSPWSELETDLFYDILRATGPDFGLMHEFFPSRSRLELKAKYNREERLNWTRLNQAMAVPTLLSDALYSHASEVIDRIKGEEIKKRFKSSKKGGVSSETTCEIAAVKWNEEEADLEAEAEEAISRILEEEEEQPGVSSERKLRKQKMTVRKKIKDDLLDEVAEEAAQVLKGKKSEKRKNELKKMYEKALRKLDNDFPKFEILIDENADAVTVNASTSSAGLPLVRLPLGTIVKVLPADGSHPQRVFFECVAKGIAVRQYVIQHQMSPGEPSTGYLHLFGTASS